MALLRQALRAGIGHAEFWDLTPCEAFEAIDAALWRERHDQRKQVVLAWRVAALQRARRLPSLSQLLNTAPTKPLRGRELRERRKEFAQMAKAVDLSKLNIPQPKRLK